jgi:hypothetical protein
MKNKRNTTDLGRYVRGLILTVILIVCFSVSAKSQQKGFGLGIMFGEPTGISFKGWLSERSAIDGGLGWSFAHNGSVHIHADYLYHFYDVFNTPRLPLYLGVGGRIKLQNTNNNGHNDNSNDVRIGIRVPFGISYQFAEVPVDIFLEIAPILDLNPETDGSVNGAIGARFYF